MALRSYAGTWRRANPDQYGSLPADPVDSSHGHPPGAGYPDPIMSGVPVGAPEYLLSDVQADAAGWGLRAGYVPDAPIDRTPVGHVGGDVDPGQAPELIADARANAARQRDQGAVARQHTLPVPLQGYTERRETERRQVAPVSMGSTKQVRYRIGSRPEDQADSHYGHEIFRWSDRKLPYKWRRPDMRPTPLGTAASVADSPPPAVGNQYTSPFNTLAVGRLRNMMRPMVRRVPRPFDETIMVDGTDGAASPVEYQPWGL